MQMVPSVRPSTMRDVAQGSCFAFSLPGEPTAVGIAVEPGRAGDVPAFIALTRKDVEGPGVYQASVLSGGPVLLLPQARILVPSDTNSIHFGLDTARAPAGALIFHGSDVGIAAYLNPRDTIIFNVSTGAEMDAVPRRDAVWFDNWRVAQPGPDGAYQSLCEVRVASR